MSTAVDDRHFAFAGGLTMEERLLIELRDVIYDRSWKALRADLNARKNREPYVIKLATRIEDDLARIDKLTAYERDHGIDLKAYLPDHNA